MKKTLAWPIHFHLPVLLVLAAGAALSPLRAEIPPAQSAAAPLPEVKAAIDKAVAAVYPALVRIEAVLEEGGEGRMRKMAGVGSGSIITPDGYVLTNHHVAGRATRIVCQLTNHEEVDATLVASDALSDLAVIKLDLKGRREGAAQLSVARFGDSDALGVGESVLAMGCPAGLSQSVTLGIVSNKEMIAPQNMGNMDMDGENVGELVRWIGHDAVIYGGNSGGPLVNLQGEIVGVNEVGIGSLGGAIPGNLAKVVAHELIEKGRVRRSWTGLEAQPLLEGMDDKDGILVASVLERSPAAQAGLAAGDVITEYDGHAIPAARAREDVPLFNRIVVGTPVGTTVTLKGRRHGMAMNWELTTIERESTLAREEEFTNWGMTARNLSRLLGLALHRPDTKGVQVHSLRNSGPAAEAKPSLALGDIITAVNGQPVDDVKALRSVTEQLTSGKTGAVAATVAFDRGTQKLLTVVKVGAISNKDTSAFPEKAWLGVNTQVLTRELSTALQLTARRGVRITEVIPETSAVKAGLKIGDVITKLDDSVINANRSEDTEIFSNLIRQYPVGSSVSLDLLREGEPLKINVALDKQPKGAEGIPEYSDPKFEFTTRELSPADRLDRQLKQEDRGLLVTRVEPAGWASLAGLRSDDLLLTVDGQFAETAPHLKQILAACHERKARRVVFFVKRGIRTHFIEIEPQW